MSEWQSAEDILTALDIIKERADGNRKHRL